VSFFRTLTTVKSQTSAALTRLRRLLPILIDDATEVAR